MTSRGSLLERKIAPLSGDNVDLYRLSERMPTKRPMRRWWLDGIDCTQLAYRDRRRVLEMLDRAVRARVVHRVTVPLR